MALLGNQTVVAPTTRTYHLSVPDNPQQATVPAIFVFHGGGQDVEDIASHWGIDLANPALSPPSPLDEYLLVFPEADERLNGHWVHYHKSDSAFPTHDLLFVEQLVTDITAAVYATPNGNVTVDSACVYAAGFSSGAGMVWQLMNSASAPTFRGFVAVGQGLDPEKAMRFRRQLAPAAVPAAVPAIYVHGTADPSFRPPTTLMEVPLETTEPANTVREMMARNLIPPGTPAATSLVVVPPSPNTTDVVIQEFTGKQLHPDKTRLIEFGRHAARARTARGLGKPETFDFLGFTHFCGKTKKGRFWLRRITISKRMRAKLSEVNISLKARRHQPVPVQGQWLGSVVRGHLAYYAVPGNTDAVAAFRTQVTRQWFKALRRRSQRTTAQLDADASPRIPMATACPSHASLP